MKSSILSVLLISTVITGCLKVETKKTKIDIPEPKFKLETYSVKKSGLKCKLITDAQEKDIFFDKSVTNGKEIFTIRELYNSTGKVGVIGVMGAQVDDYKAMNFSKIEEGDDETFVGEGIMFHPEGELLVEEGKVIQITGKLTLINNEYGTLETSVKSLRDSRVESSEFTEIGQIENCTDYTGSMI